MRIKQLPKRAAANPTQAHNSDQEIANRRHQPHESEAAVPRGTSTINRKPQSRNAAEFPEKSTRSPLAEPGAARIGPERAKFGCGMDRNRPRKPAASPHSNGERAAQKRENQPWKTARFGGNSPGSARRGCWAAGSPAPAPASDRPRRSPPASPGSSTPGRTCRDSSPGKNYSEAPPPCFALSRSLPFFYFPFPVSLTPLSLPPSAPPSLLRWWFFLFFFSFCFESRWVFLLVVQACVERVGLNPFKANPFLNRGRCGATGCSRLNPAGRGRASRARAACRGAGPSMRVTGALPTPWDPNRAVDPQVPRDRKGSSDSCDPVVYWVLDLFFTK